MKNRIAASSRISARIALAVAGTLTLGSSGAAAALTWDANAGTATQTDGAGAWLGANQWWDGTANTTWVSGSDAVFGNGGTGGAVTLANATTAQTITANSFGGTYTLGTTASVLTINGGITMNTAAGAVNLVSALTLGGPQSWTNSSTSSLTITNAAANAIVYNSNLLTLNGGAFNFVLTGSATTTGAGGVKITGGSAVTNSSTQNPFGTGTLELNSGSITNSTTATNRTISNPVSITGDFTLGSGGASGTNTFSGATSTTGARTLTVNTAQAIFNNATALSLGGNFMVNGSGGIVLSGAGGISGTGNITIGTTGTIASTIGAGPINTTGTITNNGSGANTTTLSGVIASTVSAITQDAANGMLLLSGTNTSYAGTTTLTSGTLRGTNTLATDVLNAFGTGAINLSGGTLQLKANGSGNNKTIVAGNNVTVGSNSVTVDVSNSSTNTGSNFTFGNLSLGSGQLNVTGGNTYSLRFSGTTDLTANATINPTTANLSLVGAISGSGFSLTKTGASSGPSAGGVTLSGANTYTGVTSVLEGRLTLNGNAPSGAAGTLGNATSAVLLGNTTGAVNAFLFANDYTIARDITVQSGNTGTATLGSIATSTSTTAYSGAITLGSAGSTGHNLTLTAAANHTVNITGTLQDPSGLTAGTAGVVTVSDATFANGLIDNSNNNTNGSSTMILSGSNTYSGGTVINFSGSTRINHDNAFGTGNLSIVKATITQGTSATALAGVSGISLDGNLTLNSFTFGSVKPVNLGTVPITLTANRTVSVVNGTSTVGGVISGSGRSLHVSGGSTAAGLTLNGANTFDGGLIIVGSTSAALTVTSGNASGLGAGQLTLTNSANSIVALAADTAVGSLTSGIAAATFTAGSGMTNGTYALNISGGGGDGAAGTATVSGNVITAVAITNYGKDYTSAPTITLTGAGGTGTITSTFGNSSINLNPGTARTLTLAGTNTSPAIYAGIISGTGGILTKNGSGTQSLTNTSTYTGGTNINAGTLILGHATDTLTGAVSVNGGTLDLGTNTDTVGAVTLASGSITGSGTSAQGVLTGSSYDMRSGSVSAKLAGAAAVVTKSTGGTVTLTAANTYGGNTNVNAGLLVIAGDQTGSGQLIVSTGGNLQFGDGDSTSGSSVNSGTIFVNNSSTVSLNKANGGTLTNQIASNPGAVTTLSGSNATGTTNTFTATEYSNGGSFATNSTTAGAVLAFSNSSAIDLKATNLTVGGAGDTLFTGSIYSSTNSGNTVAKNGTGTLIYQSDQGYTGETDINEGAVRIDTAQTNGGTYFVGNGGTLTTAASLLVGGGSAGLSGGVTFNRTITVNPGNGTNRTLGGTNTSGTNTFSGNVALGGSFGEDRSANLVAASGGTVDFTGVISGAGQNITKAGLGTVVLSGANTYTGATAINGGTLAINGSITSSVTVNNGGTLGGSGTITGNLTVNNGGTHAAGNSPGLETISGTTTYESGSIFAWDLASNLDGDESDSGDTGARGTNYDAVNVGGLLDVKSGAIFRVVLGTGVVPDTFWQQNQTWTNIFQFGSVAGGFSNSLLQVVDSSGADYNQSLLSSGGGYGFSVSGTTLTWSAVPESGTALAGLLLGAGLLRRRRRAV